MSGAAAVAGQREGSRIDLTVAVSLTSEHNFFTGFTENISEGGVFVATYEPLPVGTVIDFELQLVPGPGTVPVRGVVCWIREANDYTLDVSPGMGLRFVNLHPQVAEAITRFVREAREAIFYDDL